MPDGYLRDAALLFRPWEHAAAQVCCPVRAWFGAEDDRSGVDAAAGLLAGFADLEVVERPGTGHLGTLVAHWPDVLGTLRDLVERRDV